MKRASASLENQKESQTYQKQQKYMNDMRTTTQGSDGYTLREHDSSSKVVNCHSLENKCNDVLLEQEQSLMLIKLCIRMSKT